jgi:hypothetical protein
VENREAVGLGDLLGAGASGSGDRVAGALGEDRERLGISG